MYGQNLRGCREQAGLTQQQLADKIFKSRTAISKIENNEQEITLGTFREWLEVTNCELQALTILFGKEFINQMTRSTNIVPGIIQSKHLIM